MDILGHLIGGQRLVAGGRTQEVFNPAEGRAEKRVELAAKGTVEQAIAAADSAFPAW